MKSYYLAHSVSLIVPTRKWQLQIEGKYDVTFINPFYNNPSERAEDLIEALKSKKAFKEYMDNLTSAQCTYIMKRDLELIRHSDGIVAYFDRITIGTTLEMFYAAYLLRIPLYVITQKHGNHPWLRVLATKIFKTRTEFKEYLDDKNLRKVI